MAELNFPNSPTNGETYTDPVNGCQYTYDATIDSWTGAEGAVGPQGPTGPQGPAGTIPLISTLPVLP